MLRFHKKKLQSMYYLEGGYFPLNIVWAHPWWYKETLQDIYRITVTPFIITAMQLCTDWIHHNLYITSDWSIFRRFSIFLLLQYGKGFAVLISRMQALILESINPFKAGLWTCVKTNISLFFINLELKLNISLNECTYLIAFSSTCDLSPTDLGIFISCNSGCRLSQNTALGITLKLW